MAVSSLMLPEHRVPAEISRQLLDLADCRMLAPARSAELELLLVGATVLPQRQEIVRTSSGAWLFVDHSEDPTADTFGRIPVPAEEHAKLVRLDQAGVRPDVLWLAHELPSTYRDGDALPQLAPAPRHLREKDERLTQQLKFASSVLVKVAGGLLAVAAAAPLALGAAVASAGVGLDPVILGGVVHPSYPVVQWAVLAQWEWE